MVRTFVGGILGAFVAVLLVMLVLAVWGIVADSGLEDHGHDGSVVSRLSSAVFYMVAGGLVYSVPAVVVGFIVGGGIGLFTRKKK